jgi:hypothetical protein
MEEAVTDQIMRSAQHNAGISGLYGDNDHIGSKGAIFD